MLRLAADENFDHRIVRRLLSRVADVDIVRIQDAGLRNTDDRVILDWAAREGRVLLTHDVRTMVPLANERSLSGATVAGVIAVPTGASLSRVIDDLAVILGATDEQEWRGLVLFLPL